MPGFETQGQVRIARHLHHRGQGWYWEGKSVQQVDETVALKGHLTIPTADSDLLHDSAVAPEAPAAKSQEPRAEVEASSCLRWEAKLAILGLELGR